MLAATSTAPADDGPRPASLVQRWQFWAVTAVGCALLAGSVVLSVAIVDYQDRIATLQEDNAALERSNNRLLDRVRVAEGAKAELDGRVAELDGREAAVDAREQAVAVVEQQVAATSIDEGTWTVGVDVEPGTYRTAQPVIGGCYWAIYTSGSNGRDIIANDNVDGGFPTVTLKPGQDFENARCGTFVRQ